MLSTYYIVCSSRYLTKRKSCISFDLYFLSHDSFINSKYKNIYRNVCFTIMALAKYLICNVDVENPPIFMNQKSASCFRWINRCLIVVVTPTQNTQHIMADYENQNQNQLPVNRQVTGSWELFPITRESGISGTCCTDTKENQIFLIYQEIQNGAVAKLYMTNGLLIYICAFPHILDSPSSYMTLRLLHSEMPYI